MNASRPRPRRSGWLPALLLGACAAGCGPKPAVLQPLRELPPSRRVPVIVIPGFTGTQLRDAETGKLQWGNARRVFLPKDRGHHAAVPLDPRGADTVGAGHTVWRVKACGLFPIRAYVSVVHLFEDNGYALGDLSDPQPGDSLFFLAYDWRRDMEDTVRLLAAQLEGLRRARGEEVLHVNLICQSGGGRVGRWYVKYGDRTIEQVERGQAGAPANVIVDKLILVGTANGGALRAFAELHEGRRYVPLFGRLFSAELFFTFSGMFDELPAYDDDFFVDRRGRTIDVDLFDPANWPRYGWSIYRDTPRRKADRRPELFGDEATRAAHLARKLDRSRRFQRQLERDVAPVPATRYYQIQGAFRPTPSRALLHRKQDGTWVTAFLKDDWVDHDPYLPAIVTEPGDGHATVRSQRALAPQELAAMAHETVWIDGSHFAIVHDPATRSALLDFLLEPLP